MQTKLIRSPWTFIKAGAAAGAIVVLLCGSALGQTIPNPSFEADTFTVWPGYVSDQTPPAITGWTVDAANGAGLNPIGDGRSPFADNGAVPDGQHVLFIQSGASTSETTVSTTISGLTPLTTYKVTLRANARGGQAPHLRISIDGTELLAMTMSSAGGVNPYWYIAFEFPATATSHVLGLMNDTATDNTVLVDNVQIAPSSGAWVVDAWNDDASSGLDSSFYYTHAYKFGNATSFSVNGVAFTGLAGNNPQVSGSFSTTFLTYGPAGGGATVSGDSANLAVNFDYGYSIPAGSFESIKLLGLTPGTKYVATIFSYAWDAPSTDSRWATFSMGDDRLTVQQDQFGLDNGIRISYAYTADSSGTATINIAPIYLAQNVSFHVCGFCNREAVSRFVAPVITTQPHTAIVTPGLPVTFSVAANGLPAPTYQWRFNGTNIAGATNSTYAVGATYSLDNDVYKGGLNASDGTETVDNWWANEFTAVAGANVITRVDYYCQSFTAGSSATVSIYRVTDAGGNPALGATRLYSQTFTPVPGANHLNQINLNTNVALNVGDRFLVAISMASVIALSPNDVYPFANDSSTTSTGSYWDRSTNTFNLDDLSQAVTIDQALPDDGSGAAPFMPGGHLIIRAAAAPSASTAGNYDVVLTNRQGSVTSTVAQIIFGLPLANPSFEADLFRTYPGYCSGAANGPITGWTLDTLGGGGLNPANTAPFASSGPIPDGKQFAFIQAGGDILHQTVSGFTVGNPYYVHYYEGARAGNASPGMEVRVGGATVLAAHAIPSGANSYFETFSDVFTATNASLDVAFVKSNPVSGDTTAVLDDIAIVAIPTGTAPFVTRNPQPLLVSVADSATFWAQGGGSPPLALQWLKNGVAVPGATTEVLTLNNIQKAADADYSLRITNYSGSVTSAVAHLTVYEPVPDLFNSGVDSNRVGLADNTIDPHYQIILNPDGGSTNAIVQDSTVFPIAGGATWLGDTATSRWIGPQFNTSGSAGGDYIYRTVIDLTGRDPSTLIINGQWATDNTGNDVQVNGHSTGNNKSYNFNGYTAFNIYGTNGYFVAGKNNIDFLVNNTAAGYTGLRVEIIRSNVKIPPGIPPTILTPPVGQTATVGDTITFTATAQGTAPLSYQWEKNGVAIPDQTTLSLTLANVTAADSGFYSILVSNSAGSTNSSAAALNVAYMVIPGVCFGTGVAADGTLLVAPATDPHYILSASADTNFPGPNAILVSNVWPIASGAWILNGPSSAWIAPQADQSGAAYTNGTYGGNVSGDYTYQTAFNLTGQDLSKVFISGGWATDNLGTDILVNGTSSGITSGVFTSLTSFTLTATNGLVAGPNTLDFLVNNAPGTPDVPGPTGLRVDLKLISLITPKLQLSRNGANLKLVWWPTFTGHEQLLSAPTPKGPWTQIVGATSPYVVTVGSTNTFYRVMLTQ